ncbi:phosphatidate cytidylyltransferase [Candidatus Chromulinivorax destructor]|nr:phosphatidate cytidylyltransferase [Candidatus Chromulinivorax destructor]
MQTTATKNNALLRIITGIVLGAIFCTTFFYCPSQLFSLLLASILTIIVIAEWKNIFPVNSVYFWAILPFYPIAPFCMLIYLNESPTYKILVLYLFILVFTFDSASYLFGKMYGKTKIIPSISPGKSWQGAIGGYCIATLVFIAISWNNNKYIDLQTACVVSACICIIAFAGDIFESYLKRCAKIKDSSNLLPGHGGFLDRFDAIMAVSVFFFYYKVYLLALLAH